MLPAHVEQEIKHIITRMVHATRSGNRSISKTLTHIENGLSHDLNVWFKDPHLVLNRETCRLMRQEFLLEYRRGASEEEILALEMALSIEGEP